MPVCCVCLLEVMRTSVANGNASMSALLYGVMVGTNGRVLVASIVKTWCSISWLTPGDGRG